MKLCVIVTWSMVFLETNTAQYYLIMEFTCHFKHQCQKCVGTSQSFTDDLVHVLRLESYERLAAAKRHTPRSFRREYILGWNQDCGVLYERYNYTHKFEVAGRLLK
jgi:hypothetical protein